MSTSVMDSTDVILKFIRDAVKIGGEFKKPEYHAVFQYGTVVRFQIDTECKFPGFLTDYYEFPIHRLGDKSELQKILHINENAYKSLLEKYPQHVAIIKTAYQVFIDDGYPYPGGEGADRFVLPLCDKHTGLVFFMHRNQYVYQCIAPGLFDTIPDKDLSEHEFCVLGGDSRRNDFMYPKLVSFITPTLDVVRLD